VCLLRNACTSPGSLHVSIVAFSDMLTGIETDLAVLSFKKWTFCALKKQEKALGKVRLGCCSATEVPQQKCNRAATRVPHTGLQQECNRAATRVQQYCNRTATRMQQGCNRRTHEFVHEFHPVQPQCVQEGRKRLHTHQHAHGEACPRKRGDKDHDRVTALKSDFDHSFLPKHFRQLRHVCASTGQTDVD
jgi:hypothetical protein